MSRADPAEHKEALGLSAPIHTVFYGRGDIPLQTVASLASLGGSCPTTAADHMLEVAEAVIRAKTSKYNEFIRSIEQSCSSEVTSDSLAKGRSPLLHFRHRSYDGTRQTMIVPEYDPNGRDDTNFTGPVTVMAAKCGWSVLVKSAEDGAKDKYINFRGDTISSLQCQAEKPAEYIVANLNRIQVDKPEPGIFKMMVEAAVVDEDGPNLRAERWFTQQDKQTAFLLMLCDAHKIATTMSRTSNLKPIVATGMINVGVSLKGTEYARFKDNMRLEIMDIEIVHEPPSLEAIRYRDAVIKQFCPGDSARAKVRRKLLPQVFTGAWHLGRTQLYVKPGDDIELAKRAVVEIGLRLLCSRHIPVFARSNWTGADMSLDDLGLMEWCCGLLSRTYLRLHPLPAAQVYPDMQLALVCADGDVHAAAEDAEVVAGVGAEDEE